MKFITMLGFLFFFNEQLNANVEKIFDEAASNILEKEELGKRFNLCIKWTYTQIRRQVLLRSKDPNAMDKLHQAIKKNLQQCIHDEALTELTDLKNCKRAFVEQVREMHVFEHVDINRFEAAHGCSFP